MLRTNCFDCLDRTNIAQYAYGIAALGPQLQTFGYLESPDIDLDDTLARHVMDIYEIMGDKLALQYGGSPAHNKVFFFFFSSFYFWVGLISILTFIYILYEKLIN